VTNGVVHPRQQLLVNRLPVVSNDAYNSTHWSCILANLPALAQT
jgi:hypothetical protein